MCLCVCAHTMYARTHTDTCTNTEGKFINKNNLETRSSCFTRPQAYYRLGVALLGLGLFEEAIVAFAQGLAADPKQAPMLSGLTETMLKSPFRGKDHMTRVIESPDQQ